MVVTAAFETAGPVKGKGLSDAPGAYKCMIQGSYHEVGGFSTAHSKPATAVAGEISNLAVAGAAKSKCPPPPLPARIPPMPTRVVPGSQLKGIVGCPVTVYVSAYVSPSVGLEDLD